MLVRTVCRNNSAAGAGTSLSGRSGARRERGSQSSARDRDARSGRARSSANDLSDPLQMTTPMYVIPAMLCVMNSGSSICVCVCVCMCA
ncbi:unnamed protein product [Echinostoma caproni]|uniref:Secreted protein n=1 Tax=Echinostoma caproni TaxID=27848 RepID=A0A183A424_9TREM|nr:unnamed protein product [Echinostoma caproni]